MRIGMAVRRLLCLMALARECEIIGKSSESVNCGYCSIRGVIYAPA